MGGSPVPFVVASSLPLSVPSVLATLSDPIIGQCFATVAPDLVSTGARDPSHWRYWEQGNDLEPSIVNVTAPGLIIIQAEEAEFPPDRITYDGLDATLVNATGGTLIAFDELIPFP